MYDISSGIEPYMKAYFLYILGNLVFLSKTVDVVSFRFLQFLSFDRVDSFAIDLSLNGLVAL